MTSMHEEIEMAAAAYLESAPIELDRSWRGMYNSQEPRTDRLARERFNELFHIYLVDRDDLDPIPDPAEVDRATLDRLWIRANALAVREVIEDDITLYRDETVENLRAQQDRATAAYRATKDGGQ